MDGNKQSQGQLRTMIIGAFTVFGIAILVWSIFFFTPSVGDNKNKMTINFSNIEGIDVGTRVTYAGKPIGEVTSIEYIPREDNTSVDTFGNPFSYAVQVKMDSKVHVLNTDLIVIRTSGLLGEKSIAIIPQEPQPGQKVQSVIGGTVYANSEDPLSSTLKTVQEASSEITKTMSNVSQILEENQELIHQAIQSLDDTLRGVSGMVQYAQKVDMIGNANQAIKNISKASANINQMLGQVKQMQTLEKLDTFIDNLAYITNNIANGEGTLGQLINNPELYLKTLSVIERVNQLASDLNNYGLLFHRNRLWKIAQKERLDQMESLNSPTAFSQAFESDMQAMEQTLEQVTQYIDQAKQGHQDVLKSKAFKSSYLDLMKQVYRLQNLVQLYNQKISDNP